MWKGLARPIIQLVLSKRELFSFFLPAHYPPTDLRSSCGPGWYSVPAAFHQPRLVTLQSLQAWPTMETRELAVVPFLDGVGAGEPLEAAVFLAQSCEGEWRGTRTHTRKR